MIDSSKQFNELLVKITKAADEQRLSQNYIIVQSKKLADAIDKEVVDKILLKGVNDELN